MIRVPIEHFDAILYPIQRLRRFQIINRLDRVVEDHISLLGLDDPILDQGDILKIHPVTEWATRGPSLWSDHNNFMFRNLSELQDGKKTLGKWNGEWITRTGHYEVFLEEVIFQCSSFGTIEKDNIIFEYPDLTREELEKINQEEYEGKGCIE